MAFQDQQELRRVSQVLSECTYEQIVKLLREASVGHPHFEDGVYHGWIVPPEQHDFEWDDEDDL